jgi:tartrate/fumarate subfamily iron-sulfur-dependent hydro-lyase beta chain
MVQKREGDKTMTPIKLETPLSKEDVENLRVGDLVTLTGHLFTCRSQFHIHFIDEGHIPPFDPTKYHVMIHSGPIMEKIGEGWKVRAISVTTSIRFNKWEPEAIRRLGLRAIIGKGKVGKETREALKKYGCIHLARTGVFSGAYATMVGGIEGVHWLELGRPEATWLLRVKDFGPLVVEADTKGNCLFDEITDRVNSKVPEIYRKLGIEGLEFAEK